MTSILVVEDDEQFRSAVTRDLSHRGFDVTAVVSVADALSHLRARGYDVLLTDLRMGERDGIDLLTELSDVAPQTRPILMSAYATARDHQRAVELGAVQVLCKPFTSVELAHAIRQAVECESGFHGVVHGLSLVDVLQMFHFGRRSLCVIVGGRHGGQVHIDNGEIVHAEHEGMRGDDALRHILSMQSGSIRTEPLESRERSIDRPFQELLLDALRENDEEDRDELALLDEAFEPIENALSAKIAIGAADVTGICADVTARLDEALMCAVVDLESRTLMGLHDRTGAFAKHSVLIAEDVAELLDSENLAKLEGALGGAPDSLMDSIGVVREVRIVSPDSCRFVITFQEGRKAAVLLTRREVNAGLSFWYLRAAIPTFERKLSGDIGAP